MVFPRSWVPLREMEEFRHSIDDLLEHLRAKIGYPAASGRTASKPPIESFVEEEKLTVRVELPGVDPEDITCRGADGSCRDLRHASKIQ